MVEGVGFRIQVRLKAKTVFKTASISHSVTPRLFAILSFPRHHSHKIQEYLYLWGVESSVLASLISLIK
ncbi:hypothetical protein ES706_02066 [subsurface metagenome]